MLLDDQYPLHHEAEFMQTYYSKEKLSYSTP